MKYILWSHLTRAWVGINGTTASIFLARQYDDVKTALVAAGPGEEVCSWEGE